MVSMFAETIGDFSKSSIFTSTYVKAAHFSMFANENLSVKNFF